jgi:2-amino-4-hydroxy-6-hydroxymethyldihydropteridine diphosphokinase
MASIYLSLGSNLGNRAENLKQAIALLAPEITAGAVSALYETAPMYVEDQPKFLNIVCQATTRLGPTGLLKKIKAIEKEIEPTPHAHNQPRIIDVDLLFYDDAIITTPELTIPHPRITERAFVLVPLADIAPELIHPSLGISILVLKDGLGDASADVAKVREKI